MEGRRGNGAITCEYDAAKRKQIEENEGNSCHCFSSMNSNKTEEFMQPI